MALTRVGDVGLVAVALRSQANRKAVDFKLDSGQLDSSPVESTVTHDQTQNVVEAWPLRLRGAPRHGGHPRTLP
jgi:hypothetical protein